MLPLLFDVDIHLSVFHEMKEELAQVAGVPPINVLTYGGTQCKRSPDRRFTKGEGDIL